MKISIWNIPARILSVYILIAVFIAYFLISASVAFDPASLEVGVFDSINAKRLAYNLPALQHSDILATAARNWSQEMTSGNYVSGTHSIYNSYAEILAGTADFVASLFPNYTPPFLVSDWIVGWWNSAEHHAVMMTNSGGYMGVGIARNGGYFVCTVDFIFT